jgi:hypothetical protein
MKHRTIIEIAMGVAVIGALAFAAWLHQHDLAIKVQAVNAQIEKDRKQASVELAAKVAAIAKEKAETKTPEQAIKIINRYVPLPVPINLQTETVALPGQLEEKPDAPIAKDLIVPAEDAVPLAHYVEDCRTCDVELKAARVDNQKLKQERDNLKIGMKGGKWIARMGRNLKVAACSGIGGAGGSAAGAKGAAIGAVAGALVCSLF